MPAHGQNAFLIIFALLEQPLHFVKHLHCSTFNCRIGDEKVEVIPGIPDFRTMSVKHKLNPPVGTISGQMGHRFRRRIIESF